MECTVDIKQLERGRYDVLKEAFLKIQTETDQLIDFNFVTFVQEEKDGQKFLKIIYGE
jgi:hypothetical protein